MVDLHVPLRQGVLFAVGGALYYLVEVLWRGHSDWTMAVLGGVCFLLIGRINERCEWCVALLLPDGAGLAHRHNGGILRGHGPEHMAGTGDLGLFRDAL